VANNFRASNTILRFICQPGQKTKNQVQNPGRQIRRKVKAEAKGGTMQSNQGNVNGKRLGTRARYLNEVSIARRAQELSGSVAQDVWVVRRVFLNDISLERHNGATE